MLLGAYVVQTGGARLGAVRRLDPGRPARDAHPVRERDPRPARRRPSRQADAARPVQPDDDRPGYLVAAAAAFIVLVAGVIGGILPWLALIALAGIPTAGRVYRGVRASYDQPYVLMGYMGANIKLHLMVGVLLFVAYVVVLVVGIVAPSAPLYLPFAGR